ncbi:MAG: flagellar basal body-associated FliL family protein [Dehalococcoidia bacterium]|nr:flagellar basal body-associated FliL family protein [Dehalococcoidia bacterium]
MKKPIVLTVAGVVVGALVAFAAFTFLLDGVGGEVSAQTPRVVSVPGKLGPHITLSDRVFNLLPERGSPSVYLKLQTAIEFETKDPRWEHVLNGCGRSSHVARAEVPATGALMVAVVTDGRYAGAHPVDAGGGGDACEAELVALMDQFEHTIGSGRALIEDAVTSIVTGHTASEIATPEGKDALRAEIQRAVDDLIEEPRVVRVLFLNFITQ